MLPRRLGDVSIVLAVFASVLLVTARHGASLTFDGTYSCGAARYLVERGELRVPVTRWPEVERTKPLTWFPPGQTVVLAGIVAATGADPLEATRWLDAATLAVTTAVLLALVPRTLAGRLLVLAIAAGPFAYRFHLGTYSEPLFLLLCSLACLAAKALRPDGLRLPLALAALGWASTLVRYAGLFFGPAGVALFLARRGATLRSRIGQAAAFSALFLAIALPWHVRLALAGGSARPPAPDPGVAVSRLDDIVATVTKWVLPPQVPLPIRAVAVAAALGLVLWRFARGPTSERDRRAGVAALVFAAGYFVFLLAAGAFVDRDVVDPRYLTRLLAPLGLFLAVFLGSALGSIASTTPSPGPTLSPGSAGGPGGRPRNRPVRTSCGRPPRTRVRRTVAAVLAGLLAAYGVLGSSKPIREALGGDTHFATSTRRDSEAIRWLRTLPAGVTIFSNHAGAIATILPLEAKSTPWTSESHRLSELRRRLEETAPSVLVLFRHHRASAILSPAEIVAALGLEDPLRLADADVYTFGLPSSFRSRK